MMWKLSALLLSAAFAVPAQAETIKSERTAIGGLTVYGEGRAEVQDRSTAKKLDWKVSSAAFGPKKAVCTFALERIDVAPGDDADRILARLRPNATRGNPKPYVWQARAQSANIDNERAFTTDSVLKLDLLNGKYEYYLASSACNATGSGVFTFRFDTNADFKNVRL